MKVSRPVRRGQVWWVEWNPGRGSEQLGRRPALIVQADFVNVLEEYHNTIVLAMSTKGRDDVPSHIRVDPSKLNGLSETAFVRCEQVQTISKTRLDGYVGQIEPRHMAAIEQVLRDLLGMG